MFFLESYILSFPYLFSKHVRFISQILHPKAHLWSQGLNLCGTPGGGEPPPSAAAGNKHYFNPWLTGEWWISTLNFDRKIFEKMSWNKKVKDLYIYIYIYPVWLIVLCQCVSCTKARCLSSICILQIQRDKHKVHEKQEAATKKRKHGNKIATSICPRWSFAISYSTRIAVCKDCFQLLSTAERLLVRPGVRAAEPQSQ